jgi:MarR family transcriptional regulator, organic hydroperoxide resistance regulator
MTNSGAGVGTGLSSAFDAAHHSPGLLLWQLTNTWQAAQRAALRPFDLTHVQFVLLASLTWLNSDTPVTQRELATHAHTDPMMTSQVLRTLEAKGLIVRGPHPTDARARALTATPRGAELANAANAKVEAVDHAFFARLGDQQPRFTAMLKELAQTH